MADQSPQQPPEKESSPSKTATTPSKGDKTLKRKLFSSGTPEDAEKKTPKVTPKRKKTTSQPGSPTLLGTPGRSIPLSERQQVALLMQMTAEESPTTAGPAKESPATKLTSSKSKVNNQNNRGETSLHLAAIKGDIQVAESLISQGADVNAQDYAGWTALHEACNHGHSELTDLLLTAGAFVNALGSDDYTPLHDAAVNGHREVVQILLKHGANPRIYNKNGKTPLDLASSSEIRGLMLGAIIKPVNEVSKLEPVKGAASLPHSLDLDERPTTEEKKKEPPTETEAATEAIKETTPAPSSEDPYEFTQDNSNEQKITIHWASPDKTGKNSFMEITRTIPKAREQSTPVSFSSSSTSDSDLLDPQLNPIMTKALDDEGENSNKVSTQETPSTSLQAKIAGGAVGPPPPVPEEPSVVKEDREEQPLFIVEDVKPVEVDTKLKGMTNTKETVTEDKTDVKEIGVNKAEEKVQEQPKDGTTTQDGQHVTYAIPKVAGKEVLPESEDNSQESNLKLTIMRLSQDSDLVCEPSEKKADTPKRNSPVAETSLAIPTTAVEPTMVLPGGPTKRPPICETVTQPDDKKRQSPSSQIRLQVVSTQEQGSSSDSDSIREWRILQPPPETATATAAVGTETEGDATQLLEKQPQVKEKTKKHRDRSQKSHKKHKHSHSHPHAPKEEPTEVPMEVTPLVPPAPPPVVELQREIPTPSKKPEENDGKDPLAREYYIVQQKQSSSGEIKKLLLRTSLPAQITSSNEEKGIVGKVVPEPDSTETDIVPPGTTGLPPKQFEGVSDGTSGSSRGSPTVTSSDQVVAETLETKEVKEKLPMEKTEKPSDVMKSEGTTGEGKPPKVTRTLRSNSNLQNVSLHNTDEKEKEKESNVSQPMTRSRRNQLEAAASANSSNQSQDQVMDSHPRKRKIAKHRQQQQEELQVPAPPPQVPLHEQANSMEQFLSIRREMRKRQRANLLPVVPNMPNRFEEYLMHRKTYLLHRDPQSKINLAVPKMTPPEDMNPVLKENFDAQENKRHSLRLRHQIEREKLMLAAEQEVLRVYGRGARAMANQNIPFSACMVLNDMEVYNMPDPLSQEESKGNSRQRFNGRHFHSWLHDVDEKYEKIKEDLLKRHQHEAMSLYAVQKLEWELKLQEIKMWDSKKPPNISRHVPMVEIDRDFDLLPKS